MPNRIIREAILSSEKVAKLTWAEEAFYRRLQSVVDDYGRFEANPQLLRSKCYPLHTDSTVKARDVANWLGACQRAALVVCYEVGDKKYLEVLNFGQQRRTDSKFPPPPVCDSKCQQSPADAHLVVFGDGGVVGGEDAPRKRGPSDVKGVDIPDWMPAKEWGEFIEMRRAKGNRAPFTVAAAKGIVRELTALREAGHDPAVVLRASVMNGWSGVFAPRRGPNGSQDAPPTSWWMSSTGLIDKALELGIPAPADEHPETFRRFKASVWVAAGAEGPWWDDKDTAYALAVKLRNGGV